MDPITITALATAAGSALGGLLGKKKRNWTKEDLIKFGFVPYDKTGELRTLNSDIEGKLKETRANATQKAESLGIDPVTSIYANESGIYDAWAKGKDNIDRLAREEENRIADTLFRMNVNEELNTPTLGENMLSGGITGASLGSSIANMLTTTEPNLGPGTAGGGMDVSGKSIFNGGRRFNSTQIDKLKKMYPMLFPTLGGPSLMGMLTEDGSLYNTYDKIF